MLPVPFPVTPRYKKRPYGDSIPDGGMGEHMPGLIQEDAVWLSMKR